MKITKVRVEFYEDTKKCPIKNGIVTFCGDEAFLEIFDTGIKLVSKKIKNAMLVSEAIKTYASYELKRPIPYEFDDNDAGFSIVYNDDEQNARFYDSTFAYQGMENAKNILLKIFDKELHNFDVMK